MALGGVAWLGMAACAAQAQTAEPAAEQAAGPAAAQAAPVAEDTAGAGGLEEIVVTAERREANLHRTPIAITAITAAGLGQ